METKKVREHTCFQKEHPLSPVGCRCRKFITIEERDKLVSEGAQFTVRRYQDFIIEEDCPVCGNNDTLRKACANCGRTGRLSVNKKLPIYGEDIISTVNSKGKRLSSTVKKKTPRSPTIEKSHILRSVGAIGNSPEAAFERILEYEMITLRERIKLLVPNFNLKEFETAWKEWELDMTKPFPLPLRYEPEDNLQTHTGRKFDFGRPV